MTTQSSNRTRSLGWEDEAPAETPNRRVRQAVSPPGRTPGGTAAESPVSEAGADVCFDSPRSSSWRPTSGWGRALISMAALTLVGGLLTAGFLLKTYLNRDSRFRIAGAGNIQATGLTQVSRAEMLPVFGEDIGRNVFFVPLAERRKQLEQMPWIEHATVMRLLPDQIRVSVVERKPVAFVREGSDVGLVDAAGVLLTMPAATMAQHHYSFPVVSGLDPHDPPAASKTRMGVYQRLLAELDANGQHLSEQISEIDLSDPEDARVLMPEQGTDILAHFGEDHFLERYQRYKAHIAEWRQQYPKLAAVDLRYDQQVVLEMMPGTDSGQAAAQPTAATAANAAKSPPALAKKAPLESKAGKKASTKPKNAAARLKASSERKKRAAARHSVLILSKQKKTHPAVAASQGQ